MDGTEDLWVFAYGSLIWNPGIDVAETRRARLSGFRRGFCMWSIHHRGSEADPGLVLALEPHRGAMCEGLAIRAAAPRVALEELRARELISSAYEEAQVDLICEQGTRIPALAYVINTAHRQYAPDLSLDDQARIIAHAHGGRGPNHEYLTATAKSLHDLDIGDANIDALVTRVQQIKADH